jgi:hypothetical protein
MHGETEGITLLTQYNAHGIFIVLEELGYLLMSLSSSLCPCVSHKKSFGRRDPLDIPGWFRLTLVALTVVTINHG